MNVREALFWSPALDGDVRCGLCPRRCLVSDGEVGFCGVRTNNGGELVASQYGLVSSFALDPIEKKPLYMFHQGKNILSIGGVGCNLRCPFCQNYEIACQWSEGLAEIRGQRLSADDVAGLALRTVPDGNIGVAYTYNEPLISYEFLFDCAGLIHEAGLYNVLVTNGYVCTEPLEGLLPFVDAMNIDLKGFSDDFYGKVGGDPGTVMETIEMSQRHCHVEVTTLVIPGMNEDDIEELAKWLSSINRDIPLHLTRFFPRYHYSDREPTPRDTILRLQDTAKRYLRYVFTGNMR